jgi:hypothetical protein
VGVPTREHVVAVPRLRRGGVVSLATLTLVGGLSVYYPGDGHCGTQLACGGRFKVGMHHIAIRQWRGRCGAPAVVCSAVTRRCVWTRVADSGPWGASKGKRWEVQVRLKPGWRRRAVADLTHAVWRGLGSPPALSRILVWVPEGGAK